MMQLPKVLLLGNGPTSLSAFESLVERFTLVGIFRELAEVTKDKDDLVHLAQTLDVPVYFETAPASASTEYSSRSRTAFSFCEFTGG